MVLYDVLDEIASKQVTKTDTGDNRIFGVIQGIVAKNYEESMPGRVCVTIPVRDKDHNELQWARIAMPSSGKKWGHYFVPEVGDVVLLCFEQGYIDKPYVIGCIPKDNDTFFKQAVDKDNQFKKIITKNGNTVIFEDNKEGEGDKDKITIKTAKDGHSILLDNENHEIRITDKDKKNCIDIKTQDGKMSILAASRVEIKVGDNMSLIMNGESGNVTLNCTKLEVKATGGIDLNSDGNAALKGSAVSIEASSVLKVDSSGAVKIGGSPISIG